MIKVALIDWMGGDDSVVDAARVSFDKRADNYTDGQNESLIEFLAREGHDIPFAHTAITFRVSAPVPVRTQCFKSKVGFIESEESRRYITSEPEIFIPDAFREAVKDKKQGSGNAHPDSTFLLAEYTTDARYMVGKYMSAIERGVCPEQARFWLPQGVMVNWVWTGSLLAYARFYNLRHKPDAQREVQVVAEKVGDILGDLFPISWKALTDR